MGRFLILLFLICGSFCLTSKAEVIIHDISTGSLIIPGNSSDDYIITGSTNVFYVVVETGYTGVITLRNLNITLDVGGLIDELRDVVLPGMLDDLRQTDEYKDIQQEIDDLERELLELPNRADYLQKLQELQDLQAELDERRQQQDYQDLEEEINETRDKLPEHPKWNDLQAAQNELDNLGQKQQGERQAKQNEINNLWQTLYAHNLWKQIEDKRQELYDLEQVENYPGKQQDLQRLRDELSQLEQSFRSLPQYEDVQDKEQELRDMDTKFYEDELALGQRTWELRQEVHEELWEKEDELRQMTQPIQSKIDEKYGELWQLRNEIEENIYSNRNVLYQMEDVLRNEAYTQEMELYQVLSNSPISVKGQHGLSNLTPVTNVDFILEGNNILTYTGTLGYAAFHVEQGAQINIMAIDPSDNTSGKLTATVVNEDGGAGIGSLNHERFDKMYEPYGIGNIYYLQAIATVEATATAEIIGGCLEMLTAGGNIVISSGTITAQGGHGAGIGGGWGTYYDGMIVIYGGIVDASSIRHAAGMGGGCPTGIGVIDCYTPNSAIIVLPPAQITAAGSGNAAFVRIPDLALAGSNNIVYIGDPEKPLITVHTEDFEGLANIYVDLSESPNIANVIYATVAPERLDINKVKFGQAGSNGMFTFHGILDDNITFFTDATSSRPQTLKRPYLPKVTQLPDGDGVNRTVILELLKIALSVETTVHSTPISICGYTTSDALSTALRVNIIYSDDIPMTDVVFDLANGAMSDFSTEDMKFYASNGTTEIQAPTTLNKGDVIFIAIPLKVGKTADVYSDVLRFTGTWNYEPVDYIRQVITQEVLEISIAAYALPTDAGSVIVDGCKIGETINIRTIPNTGYNFVHWTENGNIVTTNTSYTFTAEETRTLVAIYTLSINISANNNDGGTVSGEGIYIYGDEVTAVATPKNCYRFVNWTENGIVVSTDEYYEFSATPRNLVANFEKIICTINVEANNSDYGYATGAGIYEACDVRQVQAFVNDCYRFVGWTVDGELVSTDNPYVFTVMEDVDLVALFYALDFDTYASTLWDNTFMLNLKKLDEDGYEVTGCIWLKNGVEEMETRTINEYSYSAGPNITDKLEPAPTYYMFHLLTSNFGLLCSSQKTLNFVPPSGDSPSPTLLAYPNPLSDGSRITIEGVTKGSMIYVYNLAGVHISSVIASNDVVTLTLPDTDGIYLIRNEDKSIKVVVKK